MLKLEIYENADGFDVLRDEWSPLLANSATNEVFLTWEWQSTWWEVYQPGDLRLIAARNTESGALVGIAAWFIEQPSRTLRSIGCVDVTDYVDVIAAPDQRDGFFAALADWLAAHTADFSCISLCNIPSQSVTLEALPGQLTERGFFVEAEQQEVCPVIPLPATFDEYLAKLDKKNRHELRRKIRRAQDSESEKVAWYIVTPEHSLERELECFIGLMAASHPDKAAFMQDEKNAAFFRTVMPKIALCGWLQLSFLTINGEQAAAYLSFDYDNRIGLYNSGLLPRAYGHLSTGIVLLAYIIEYAIQQKRTVFDFLRGNEEYKYRMGAQDTSVIELKAHWPDAATS